ncbi:MAG: B-box zinc finger protein [Candidatus Hydrogenedentes bacterium]|nr:B-box zinc finger protein [Candidatus Hydrogenedentota bacterium]
MRNTIVRCGQCNGVLGAPATTGSGSLPCPTCRTESRAWLFPALYRSRDGQQAQALQEEGHSSCMNHPQKRAVAVCDGCGKFLCALCDVDWNGEHLCPACIGHRKTADPEGTLRTEYMHYDLIALTLVLVSIPMWVFGIVLAPMAVFIGIRYWNTPLRPVPYRRWPLVLVVLLGAVVFVGLVSAFTAAIFFSQPAGDF